MKISILCLILNRQELVNEVNPKKMKNKNHKIHEQDKTMMSYLIKIKNIIELLVTKILELILDKQSL